MSGWFERSFGAAADEIGNAIADARAKLIDEGWFGRRTPEPHQHHDLEWSRDDHPSPAESQSPTHDHGIDR
jgi:hypothetical protein